MRIKEVIKSLNLMNQEKELIIQVKDSYGGVNYVSIDNVILDLERNNIYIKPAEELKCQD
jgi:hypothetical protein